MRSIQEVFKVPAMQKSSLLAVFRCTRSDAVTNKRNWEGIEDGWTAWWELDDEMEPDGTVVLIDEKGSALVRVYAAPGAKRVERRGLAWKLQATSPFQYLATIRSVSKSFLGWQMPPGVTYVKRKGAASNADEWTSAYASSLYDFDGRKSVIEKKKLVLHLRTERNRNASAAAKAAHGTICQACDFNFGGCYGEIGVGFIEAHHLTPISALKVGQSMTFDAKKDFVVLCSNCHSMIHRPGAPSDIRSFRKLLRRKI